MDNRAEKAFEFAQETTKQLLTLATAVIALTIAFIKDFAAGASLAAKTVMAVSWLFFLLSVVSGLLTLMALTGTLAATRAPDLDREPTITGTNVTRPARLQALSFFLGLLLMIVAGLMAF
jgi:hypothetical protein